MVDIWRTLTHEQIEEISNYTHLDYIFVQNLLLYMITFGIETLKALRKTGIFNSRKVFIETAKLISNKAKRYPQDSENTKQKVCELATIVGFMDATVDEIDIMKEVESLAAKGNKHGLRGDDWQSTFAQAAKRMISDVETKEYVSFEKYVKTGMWLTAGSSSIGKVRWTSVTNGFEANGTFKARKNMLPQIYTPEELYDLVMNWDGKLQSRVFIKNEMSKLRLAVASNIEAYIHESYMLHLYGHGFKDYPWITLDETPSQQHQREVKMIELLLNGSYAFPFDYANFDHQPTLFEIQTIVSIVKNIILENMPWEHHNILIKLFDKILNSYEQSYLSGDINGVKFSDIKVEGGVPSGVRITSLLGNLWNIIMLRIVLDIVEGIAGKDLVQLICVKGDDLVVMARDPIFLYLIRLVFASINAEGADSKIGISPRVCEFLRNEISDNGIRGWTCRAIGGLSQRKPWNPSPWDPNSEVKTLAENICLLERRVGYKLPQMHRINKIKWSKYTRQSYKFLELPKRLGGFGLYEYQGWLPSRKLPLAKKPLIQVQDIHPSFVPYITLTTEQSQLLGKVEMTAKIQTDDIPGTQKLFSSEWLETLRKTKVSWNKDKFYIPNVHLKVAIPNWDSTSKFPSTKLKYIKNPDFPLTFEQFLRQYNYLKEVKRFDKTLVLPSLMESLQNYFPQQASELDKLEKQGFHRTDALNIIMGDTPTEPTIVMHPTLTCFVKEFVQRKGVQYLKGRQNIARSLYSWCSSAQNALLSSTLSLLYRY